jgi:hypothetical protein
MVMTTPPPPPWTIIINRGVGLYNIYSGTQHGDPVTTQDWAGRQRRSAQCPGATRHSARQRPDIVVLTARRC